MHPEKMHLPWPKFYHHVFIRKLKSCKMFDGLHLKRPATVNDLEGRSRSLPCARTVPMHWDFWESLLDITTRSLGLRYVLDSRTVAYSL